MTPEEAPVGTIVTIGNPASGVTARKATSGQWFYTHQHDRTVDYDDIHKAATLVFAPGSDLPIVDEIEAVFAMYEKHGPVDMNAAEALYDIDKIVKRYTTMKEQA